MAIEAVYLAKELSSATPAKAVFGSVGILLAMIRVCTSSTIMNFLFTCNQDSMANEAEYVELGLACAEICRVLDRGMNGKELGDLSQSVREEINQLMTWVRPAVHHFDSHLTMLLIVEPWRTSKGMSSKGMDGIKSFDSFMRGTIGRRLPIGSWTSIGPSTSSTWVPLNACDHH